MAGKRGASFDPARYKNRQSARQAARNYERKGEHFKAGQIRRAWGIGQGNGNGQDAKGQESYSIEATGHDTTGEDLAQDGAGEGFVFEVAEQESLTPDDTPEAPEPESKPMTDSEAKDLAGVFLLMLQTTAVNMTGTREARFTSDEREMIQPALQRILIRNVRAARHLSAISDPLALVMGFGLWGRRVLSLRQPKPEPAPQYHVASAPAQPEESAPANPAYTAGDVAGEVMTNDMLLYLFPQGADI